MEVKKGLLGVSPPCKYCGEEICPDVGRFRGICSACRMLIECMDKFPMDVILKIVVDRREDIHGQRGKDGKSRA